MPWQETWQGTGECEEILQVAHRLFKAAQLQNDKLCDIQDEEFTTPEVIWLAEQADRCPVPAGWCRCQDEIGRFLFVHENSAFSVQYQNPMLGYFVSLMSMMLATQAGSISWPQLRHELQLAKARITAESEAVNRGWNGPWRVGPWTMWHSEATGWSSVTDPSAAPRHLLEVLESLEVMLQHLPGTVDVIDSEAQHTEVSPSVLRSTSPVDGLFECDIQFDEVSAKRSSAATPSTAAPFTSSPPSAPHSCQFSNDGGFEKWYSPMASPANSRPSPLRQRGSELHEGVLDGHKPCSWFVIASPATTGHAASETGADSELCPPTPRCMYFAMSPAATDKLVSKDPASEELDVASELDWAPPICFRTDSAATYTQELAWEAGTPSFRITVQACGATDSPDEVRPQRLDFTPSSSSTSPVCVLTTITNENEVLPTRSATAALGKLAAAACSENVAQTFQAGQGLPRLCGFARPRLRAAGFHCVREGVDLLR